MDVSFPDQGLFQMVVFAISQILCCPYIPKNSNNISGLARDINYEMIRYTQNESNDFGRQTCEFDLKLKFFKPKILE
jgi:hypothetical protein